MIANGVCGIRTCFLRLRQQRRLLLPVTCHGRFYCSTCSVSLPQTKKKQKVIVISGPTGAGKSRLALELAKQLNGEIISADSVQVYQGLDVGSAKPSQSDREEVPHHLIDILHPSEDYSAGKFYEDARKATKDILDNGRVPIVTGGTGLYLRWYIYGKPDVPKASPEIAAEAFAELQDLQKEDDWDAAVKLVVEAGDPKAQFLAPNDWYRLRRSLEIIKSSGSPPSAFSVPYHTFKEGSNTSETNSSDEIESYSDVSEPITAKDLDYEFLCFFLSTPRVDLYRSIDLRCENMLSVGQDGILSEAISLLDMGLLPNTNSATRAIGYRQAMEYLIWCRQNGGASSTRDFSAFLADFQKASRNFAKRQMTWFRNEHIYEWLNASRPLEMVLNYVCDAYQTQTGTLPVPEELRIHKDRTNRREVAELKGYRTRNRFFTKREDCSDIIDWIRTTQADPVELVHS